MIGTRGEDIFKTWKPDVVVTDMMLPDADGLELPPEVQADPRGYGGDRRHRPRERR
jgi:CheY-like chemotaxis protein